MFRALPTAIAMAALTALAWADPPPATPKSLAGLPSPVQEALSWLPAECEALFVATKLELPVDPLLAPREGAVSALATFVFGDLRLLEKNGYPATLLGKTADWALHAARGIECTSKFGAFRYEGCTIYGLESLTAEDRQTLTNWLAEHARSMESIGKTKVYKFPSGFVRDAWAREKPWEGVFVTWVEDDALVVATSDDYLRELIGRVAQADRTLSLPASVLDWSDAGPAAKVWGIRSFPANAETDRPESRTTFYTTGGADSELRIVYRPTIEDGLRAATKGWEPEFLTQSDDKSRQARFEQIDGAIAVAMPDRVTGSDVGSPRLLWQGLALNGAMLTRLEDLAARPEQ